METNCIDSKKISHEASFKHLFITFKGFLTEDPKKREKFKALIRFMIEREFIISQRVGEDRLIFTYDKNKLSKSELYNLLMCIFVRNFSENMPLNTFVRVGCTLFEHGEKSPKSIYASLRRHRNNDIHPLFSEYL
jgi:hypothetical protein